jgi:hypothetical protein
LYALDSRSRLRARQRLSERDGAQAPYWISQTSSHRCEASIKRSQNRQPGLTCSHAQAIDELLTRSRRSLLRTGLHERRRHTAYNRRRTHRSLNWSFSGTYNLRATVELERGRPISPGASVSPTAAREPAEGRTCDLAQPERERARNVRGRSAQKRTQPLVRVRAVHAVVCPRRSNWARIDGRRAWSGGDRRERERRRLEGGRQAVERRQRARAGEKMHARERRVGLGREIYRTRDQVQEEYSADVVLAYGELWCLRARVRVNVRRDGGRSREWGEEKQNDKDGG